jgi:hypothetical protein
MKKLVCLLAVIALTAPLYAAVGDPNVDVTCDDLGSGVCQVSYEVQYEDGLDPGALVRGFALDIEVSGNATITSVSNYDGETPPIPPDESDEIPVGYPIHITNIDFGTDPNNVNDYGSPVTTSDTAMGGLGTNGITVEFASLYDMNATTPTPPASSGILLNFTVDFGGDATTQVTITANALRGEIVLEDLQHANIVAPGCELSGLLCMADGHPAKAAWDAWGQPDCWCWKRQCRGDVNSTKNGPFWVQALDKAIFRAAFNKSDVVLAGISGGICSDLNHIKNGPFRVQALDKTIFRLYFNKSETLVPLCSGVANCGVNGWPCDTGALPNTEFNFWTD